MNPVHREISCIIRNKTWGTITCGHLILFSLVFDIRFSVRRRHTVDQVSSLLEGKLEELYWSDE